MERRAFFVVLSPLQKIIRTASSCISRAGTPSFPPRTETTKEGEEEELEEDIRREREREREREGFLFE